MSDYMNKDESSSANMPQIFAKGQFGVSDVGSDSLPEVLKRSNVMLTEN